MTDARATAALIGGIGLLERAINYSLGSLHNVTAAALVDPTPCRGWDLRGLLCHLDDSFTALREAADLGRVSLDTPADTAMSGPELICTIRSRACQLIGAWTNADHADHDEQTATIAGSPVTHSIMTSAGAIEIAVHGWDVARACGRQDPIPAALADELLDLSHLMVSGADRPGRFATAIDVRPGATASDRLLAFLGRDARAPIR